jgi:ATP-dependent Clp protease ATP-binding subunit ClpA
METIQKQLDREVIRLVVLAKRMCAEAGIRRLDPAAWVSAMLRFEPNSALPLLGRAGADIVGLRAADRENLAARSGAHAMSPGAYFTVRLDERCRPMLRSADTYRLQYRQPMIRLSYVLLGALKTEPGLLAFFERFGVKLPTLESLLNDLPRTKPLAPAAPAGSPVSAANGPDGAPMSVGDPLQQFFINLTARAAAGQLDPVIGREEEFERVVTILRRRRKNNPLLVGPPGCGKTAIGEGLAQRIVAGQVPRQLAGREIYGVDLAAIVAGTQYRGQFEERFQALLAAARARTNCVLFIDEAHMIVGAGGVNGTTMDAGNLLKPALARGEICCIAATTDSEYRQHLRKDKALERRFQRVDVHEPSARETAQMLRGLRAVMEAHHSCRITDEAIEAAVELLGRHVNDRFFPDKALDALDETCARLGATRQPVGRVQVARAVAAQIGAPVETVLPEESDRAGLVHAELARLVVGQEQAVAAVTRAVRRAFSPLRDPHRPLACLAFVGPSSTGKTHVAQVLSRCLYANTPMIRINLAEYGEAHSVSRLFGAPPGYLGHGQGNQFTDQIRRHPHAVVLLDNADKANPAVITALMEALDVGRVTDAEGNVADLRRAFIILTTVAGCLGPVRCGVGFRALEEADPPPAVHGRFVEGCRDIFGEEFVNRLDEVVPFVPLGPASLRQVAELAVAELNARLAASGRQVHVEDDLLDHLATTCANARQVRATFRTEVEPLLCTALAASRRPVIHIALRDGRYVTDNNERMLTRCNTPNRPLPSIPSRGEGISRATCSPALPRPRARSRSRN